MAGIAAAAPLETLPRNSDDALHPLGLASKHRVAVVQPAKGGTKLATPGTFASYAAAPVGMA